MVGITTPRIRTPGVLSDRGQALFPRFQDQNAAASLEVVEFDARNAVARSFKVQNRNGTWVIPSQHDYPADARDRVASTAAAIVALRKEDFATDTAGDYERCGVLDPLDTTLPTLRGRGIRIIIRDVRDQLLADVIVGNPVEGHRGFRYVRNPTQSRVYTTNLGDFRISTAFVDWIERDLLEVRAGDIDAVNLRNYSFDRTTGSLKPGETLLLQRSSENQWTLNGLSPNERLNATVLDGLLQNLTRFEIAGVLPKPAGITATLSGAASAAKVTPEDRTDLARKGFYLTPDGQLVSNRGEAVIRTVQGVYYTLRFGDVALDSGSPQDDKTPAGTVALGANAPTENRYLFIMVDFDAKSAGTSARVSEGAAKAQLLRARFAPWYYLIAGNSFAGFRLKRSDLVRR